MRKTPSNRVVAPPKVWVATAAVCVIGAVLFSLMFRKYLAEDRKEFISSGIERVEAFSQGPPGGERVVALGTSLLYFATFFDEKMDSFALSEGHAGLRFLRIARARGSFEYFAPLLQRVLTARPDVVVVEHDLLFYRWDNPAREPTELIKEKIKTMLGIPFRPSPLNLLDGNLEPGALSSDPSGYGDTEAYAAMRPYNSEVDARVEEFLMQARSSGVTVIILKMPRTQLVESVMSPAADMGAIEERMKRYRALGARELSFPETLDMSHYLDYSHLNEKGRAVFTRWLVSRLEDIGREAARR